MVMDLLTMVGLTCEDIQSDILHYLTHIYNCENCQKNYPKLAKFLKER